MRALYSAGDGTSGLIFLQSSLCFPSDKIATLSRKRDKGGATSRAPQVSMWIAIDLNFRCPIELGISRNMTE
jgi:hypothetical protein